MATEAANKTRGEKLMFHLHESSYISLNNECTCSPDDFKSSHQTINGGEGLVMCVFGLWGTKAINLNKHA